ncbi:hypothetical protein CXU19_01290 [Akkermansia muciniphila]|nr:hypothetical protein CXU19_01290 [Akkermansia muciniphila]PNC40238.1 hypothetical protein CXU20_02605 [Akkermansia muciniphila]PNC41288.1 hypothetical protein CXU10_00225 [Akkermansia muciniphila]
MQQEQAAFFTASKRRFPMNRPSPASRSGPIPISGLPDWSVPLPLRMIFPFPAFLKGLPAEIVFA